MLLTQAAATRLGDTDLKSLLPFHPFISPESALEIAELMIWLHMEARHTGFGRSSLPSIQRGGR